ncbi:MAG TPA: RHS repeat-associated core domain-containing protein, partial [Pyrinomonadaceae bacterium]|nr:RHS repeat-associated core domain-containing protein [Pyrinomonadaceae bacterium]
LLSVTQPGGSVTRYEYDPAGNLISSADANGRKTLLEYDQLNRLIKKTFPDATTERTTYDGAGNITSITDRAGRTTTYERDQMDRLTLIRYPDGKTVAYTHTATGQRDTVTDERGVTDFDYDALGNVTQVRYPDGTAISYAYDLAGNRTAITTPDGTTHYGYDKNTRLATVTDPRGLVTSYTYDSAGNVAHINHPNGLVTSNSYDRTNQLTAITTTRPDGQTVFHETYTNDASGKRTRVARSDGSAVAYAYDAQSRLTSETYVDASGSITRQTRYTYDAVGNRLTITDGVANVTHAYTYNANDQLLSDGTSTFAYDANGNTISKSISGSATQFAYDTLNRLTQVTQPDGTTVSYAYDADGNRVRATDASGAVTNYVVDPTTEAPRVLVETDGEGRVVATYTYGLGLISQRRQGFDSFYLQDALGSTRALTDASGNVTDSYTYDAFGQLTSSTGSTANSFLYAGEQHDASTDLYYLRARYYNPSAGRFMSSDRYQGRLSAPTTQHKYAYAENDPVNSTDPTGRFTREEGIAMHQIIGRYYLGMWGDYWVSQKVLKASKAKRLKGLVYGPNGKGAYDRYVRTGNPGKGDRGAGRPDLRNYETGDVYEIKPFNPDGIRRALEEVTDYVQALNLLEKGAPEDGPWIYGSSSFFPAVTVFPFDSGRMMGVFAPPLSIQGCIFYFEIPQSETNALDALTDAANISIRPGMQALRSTQSKAKPGVLTAKTVGKTGLRLVVNNAHAQAKAIDARAKLAPVLKAA